MQQGHEDAGKSRIWMSSDHILVAGSSSSSIWVDHRNPKEQVQEKQQEQLVQQQQQLQWKKKKASLPMTSSSSGNMDEAIESYQNSVRGRIRKFRSDLMDNSSLRLRTLSPMMHLNPSGRKDVYGFDVPSHLETDYCAWEERWLPTQKNKQEQFAQLWERSISSSHASSQHPQDLLTSVLHFARDFGLPSNARPLLWMRFSQSADKMRSFGRRRHYEALVRAPWPSDSYRTECVDQIEKDLPRTFSGLGNDQFRAALKRALECFCKHYTGLGYTQGISLVLAGLLSVMGYEDLEKEEESFWMMCHVTEHVLSQYYCASMSGVKIDATLLQEMISVVAPQLAQHFDGTHVSVALIYSRLAIPLFLDTMPSESVFRVWDMIFLAGPSFTLCFVLALLKRHENDLIQMADDVEQCIFLDKVLSKMYDDATLTSLLDEALNYAQNSFPNAWLIMRRAMMQHPEENIMGNRFKWPDPTPPTPPVAESSSNPSPTRSLVQLASGLTSGLVSFFSRERSNSIRAASPDTTAAPGSQRMCCRCEAIGEHPMYRWSSLGETQARPICDKCFDLLLCNKCKKHRPDVQNNVCGICADKKE